MATGLLVSALFGSGFFLYSHRLHVGDSLIQWGERLGARSKLQTVPAEPRTQPAAPSDPGPQETMATASPPAFSLPMPVFATDERFSRLVAKAVKPEPLNLGPMVSARSAPIPFAGAATSPAPAPPSLPATPVAPTSNLNPGVFASTPPAANDLGNRIEVAIETGGEFRSEKYLEVGKFKDRSWADRTTGRLAQFGFPAIVTQRGHLWMSSYYVLAGPYRNDREVEAAHEALVSRGFKTRSFEKGSRSFTLRSGSKPNGILTLNGISIPAGDYTIRWESYASDAVVKFEKDNSVVLTTGGKLVRQPDWHESNALVYQRNANGSRILLEIRFAGTNQTLVFGKSS